MRLSQAIYLAPLAALLAQGLPISDAAAETGIVVRATDDEAWKFETNGAAEVETKRAVDDEAWKFETNGAAEVETKRAVDDEAWKFETNRAAEVKTKRAADDEA